MSIDQTAADPLALMLSQLFVITEQLKLLCERQDAQIQADNRLAKQIERFIDPAMDLQGTLKQIIASQQRLKMTVEDLQRVVRDEHRDTRGALDLGLGYDVPKLAEREVGRN